MRAYWDLLQAAETGSGKTGAFGIPVVQLVHEIRRRALLGGDSLSSPASAPTGVPSTFLLYESLGVLEYSYYFYKLWYLGLGCCTVLFRWPLPMESE